MFENLKQQIAKDLLLYKIDTIDDYVYELHKILQKYLKQVPEKSDYEFYEFAAKFLQYIINEDLDILDNDSICDIFITCPTEICKVTNAWSAQTYDDITSDIIKIVNSAKSLNIVNNEEEAEIFLDSIFTFMNVDWKDTSEVECNWNQVMLMTSLDKEIIEGDYHEDEQSEFNDYITLENSDDSGIIFYDDTTIKELEADGVIIDWYKGPGTYDTFNDFTPVDLVSDFPDKEEDDPNFGVDALFNFVCVTGPDSADQALEIIYNECEWIGHPEDEIEAGTDFPIYGVINQEEADNFNANMNAIFTYYEGDPIEFALTCIDANAVEDLNDSVENEENIFKGTKLAVKDNNELIEILYEIAKDRVENYDSEIETIDDVYESTNNYGKDLIDEYLAAGEAIYHDRLGLASGVQEAMGDIVYEVQRLIEIVESKYYENDSIEDVDYESISKFVITELKQLGYSEGDIVKAQDVDKILISNGINIYDPDIFDIDNLYQELNNFDIYTEDLIAGSGPGNYYYVEDELDIQNLKKELYKFEAKYNDFDLEFECAVLDESQKVFVSFSKTIKAYGDGFSECLTLEEATNKFNINGKINSIVEKIKNIAKKYNFIVKVNNEFNLIGD